MKNFLIILITISLVSVNAFALSGKRRAIERESCYIASVNNGESKSFAKAYCNCLAKEFDGKYTDKQLDALVDKGMEYLTNEIRPLAKKCYDKVS